MLTREWSDWRNGDWWWIQSVYVVPAWRRQGVFAALYRHVEELALATPGVVGLRLYVERGNDAARRTYAALDMVDRSEEHTSELQSLMRISYAVFCLKNKIKHMMSTNIYYIVIH